MTAVGSGPGANPGPPFRYTCDFLTYGYCKENTGRRRKQGTYCQGAEIMRASRQGIPIIRACGGHVIELLEVARRAGLDVKSVESSRRPGGLANLPA